MSDRRPVRATWGAIGRYTGRHVEQANDTALTATDGGDAVHGQ